MTVQQTLEFQQKGLDEIQSALNETKTAFTDVETAKDKAFQGLEADAKKAADSVVEVGSAASSASSMIDKADKSSTNAAKGMSVWQSAISGSREALRNKINSLSVFGVSLGDVRKRISDTRKSLADYAVASRASGQAAQAAGKSGAAGFGIARVGALALRAALGPIGVILGLVAGAFAVVAAAAARSEPILDKISVITAQVGAAFDVLADRASFVADAFVSLFSGDIGLLGFFGELGDAVSGVNAELSEEIRLTGLLKEQSIELARENLLLNAQRSLTAARLKELNFIAEDTTKTSQEQISALQEALAIEEDLNNQELENAKQRLANKLGEQEVDEKTLTLLKQLQQGQIEYNEVRDQIGLSRSNQQDVEEVLSIVSEIGASEAASLELRTTANNKLNTIQTKGEADRLKAIEERRKAEQALFDFRVSIEEQLTQLAIDESEGEERIALERRVALAQIDTLEQTARERFEAARQAFDLDEEFAELRAGVERDFAKQAADFRIEERRKELAERQQIELAQVELLSASADQELTLEEFKAQQRAEIVRNSLQDLRRIAVEEFGEGSVEVLEIDVQIRATEQEGADVLTGAEQRARDEIQKTLDLRLKGIDQQREIELARVDLITEGNNRELTLEQEKELKKTEIQLKALLDRRAVLVQQFGENSPEIELLDLQAAGLQQQIDGLNSINLSPLERIKKGIQDAFHLDDETTALLGSQITGAFNSIVSGLESIFERQLAEQDRLIEQIDARVETLQSALETELELQEQGLANDADLRQRELDEELQQRERAEAKRLEIEKRAARQQLIIESAQQVSSLSLAAAKLLASEASKGLVGLVLAGAGIATIFSIAARARAQAEQFKPPSFRDGGLFEGLLVGPSHEQGGIGARYTKNGKTYIGEMEGGEHVMPVKQTKQFLPALEAIRTDAIAGISNEGILQLLGRNPTNGIRGRVRSIGPNNNDAMAKLGRQIVSAVTNNNRFIPDGKGGYKVIDPVTGQKVGGGKL